MTVLLHLSRVEKSYLLTFEKSMTKSRVRRMLDQDEVRAAQALLTKSVRHVEIPSKDRQKASLTADFVLSQAGYSSERLA